MLTNWHRRGLAAVLGTLAITAAAPSQTISLSPGTVLVSGTQVTIHFVDSSRGGQDVDIEIDSGFPTPIFQTVRIRLGQDGAGSATWTVPNWRSARFNASGAPEVLAAIK